MRPRPFKYKTGRRPTAWPVNRIRGKSEDERLEGFVRGKEASELEERFARALDGHKMRYVFQEIINTPYQVPGQKNEIDFIVDEFGTHPIEIDGTWIHKSPSQKSEDALRDAIIDDITSKWGWERIVRIPGNELESQDQANKVAEELFT